MADATIDSTSAKRTAIDCFNGTWDLMDKKDRSAAETCEMLGKAHASLFLWQQVEGHTPTNLSIGFWQVSRAYAVAGDGPMAKLFGERCVELSSDKGVDPFFLAYAYEAVARGLSLEMRRAESLECVRMARAALAGTKETELDAIERDLAELEKA